MSKVTTVTKAIELNLERSYLVVEHIRFGLGRDYLESEDSYNVEYTCSEISLCI